MSDESENSTYPVLEKPQFTSQIPAHLLADASEAERHIMSQLSILTQFADWDVKAHMATNAQVRRTNGRLLKAEAEVVSLKDDKKLLKSGWKALVVIAGVISGLISFVAFLYQTFVRH